VLDANGLTEGGVRTPWVDVPISRLSGSEIPAAHWRFSPRLRTVRYATLDRLYPGGKKEYLKKSSVARLSDQSGLHPFRRQERNLGSRRARVSRVALTLAYRT